MAPDLEPPRAATAGAVHGAAPRAGPGADLEGGPGSGAKRKTQSYVSNVHFFLGFISKIFLILAILIILYNASIIRIFLPYGSAGRRS